MANAAPRRESRILRLLRAAAGRLPKTSQECRTQLDAALKGLHATSEVNRIVVQGLRQRVERDQREANGEASAHA